jgi:hypothetical protein
MDVPRRSGTSFRVSLQPHSRRKRRSGGKISTIQEDEQFPFQERFDDCMTGSLTKVTGWISTQTAKRVAAALVLSCLLGTIINLVPSPGQHPGYDSYVHLSTEDRVAQHEYSGEDDKRSHFFSNVYDIPSNTDKEKQATVGEPTSYEGEGKQAVLASYGSAAGVRGPNDKEAMPHASSELADSVTKAEKSTSHVAPVRRDLPTNRTVVAYVLPVFMCYSVNSQFVDLNATNEPANDQEFRDAALMLQASVHQNSIRNPSSGSVYDYRKCHALPQRTLIKMQVKN